MSPLFGPILAQIVTLGVADRTEARYVVSDDKYTEAVTAPRVGLNAGWHHGTLTLGYGPAVTVTPLGSDSRQVLVLHSAALAASYRSGRTLVTLSETATYGRVNLRAQALGDPGVTSVPSTPTGTPPGGMTPAGGTATPPSPGGGTTTPVTTPNPANQIRASNQAIPIASSATDLSVANNVSQILTLGAGIGYSISGSVGADASRDYPVVRGPRAQVSATYHPTRHDDVTTTISTQLASSRVGSSWILQGNETWAHTLDRHAATTLGAGLSITRTSLPNGLVTYAIYPNFSSGIGYTAPLARGVFGAGVSASAAPAIDPVRAAVDPRLRLGASLGWTKDRFTSSLAGGSALSLTSQDKAGALNSVSGAFGVSYRLVDALSVDSGVRGFWQSFEGRTTVTPTYAAFVGVTFGVQSALNH